MRIKKIVSRNRRDFWAIYECEHCGHTHEDYGYDDKHFHENIIPKKKCPSCGQVAVATDYLPLATKYQEGDVV